MPPAQSSTLDVSRVQTLYNENKEAVWICAGVATAGVVGYFLYQGFMGQGSQYGSGKSTLSLGAGNLNSTEARSAVQGHKDLYDDNKEVQDTSKVPGMVSNFYDFVTDIYEWGWGHSFHFSPGVPGRSWLASEEIHESRIAAVLDLQEGKTCVDCGCGIGGPMRYIAKVSGAKITGVTINQYQVDRANYYNKKKGLQDYCKAVQGNFMDLKFDDASFDAAYAIEATCHADKLEKVYGEIFRVLKPGGKFVSYEWVSLPDFDPNNKEHATIIQEINLRNGLPNMRRSDQLEQAAKNVGFEVVVCRDLDLRTPGAKPWQERLGEHRPTVFFYRTLIGLLTKLRLVGPGVMDTYNLLAGTLEPLYQGGEKAIFSPHYMLVVQKPTKK